MEEHESSSKKLGASSASPILSSPLPLHLPSLSPPMAHEAAPIITSNESAVNEYNNLPGTGKTGEGVFGLSRKDAARGAGDSRAPSSVCVISIRASARRRHGSFLLPSERAHDNVPRMLVFEIQLGRSFERSALTKFPGAHLRPPRFCRILGRAPQQLLVVLGGGEVQTRDPGRWRHPV